MPSSPAPRSLTPLLGAAGIAVAALAAFWPSLGGGFVFDDHALVEQSELLAGPLWRIWFSTDPVDYWPLTYTGFWVEWRLWGAAPLGYHVVNVLLHAAVAILLWRALRLLGVPGAWLAGLLFAIHPVAVESVAWISERKNVLSGVLFLGSGMTWIRFRERGGGGRYAAALALFLLALLAKSSTVMLPFVLLGAALWRDGRLGRRDFIQAAPFFLLSLAMGLVTVWFQWTRSMAATGFGRGIAERVGGAAWAWLTYLWTAFQPFGAAVLYPRWPVGPRSPWFWLPLLLAAAVTAILWRYRRGWARGAAYALGYHALMVLPVLGLLDITFFAFAPAANHLQYLALMGPVALVAAALARAAEGRWRPLALGATALLLVALAVHTARRASAYRDDLSLWSAAVREAPQSLAAAWMLADRLGREGRRDEALATLGAAANRIREPGSRLRARALLAAQERRFSEALADLATARGIREDPLFDEEVASLLIQAGRHAEAVALLEPLVRSDPGSPERRYWLGVALVGAGRLPEALGELREGCRLSRGRAQACAGVVVVLARMGRAAEARTALAEALGVDPGDPQVRGWLERSGVPGAH